MTVSAGTTNRTNLNSENGNLIAALVANPDLLKTVLNEIYDYLDANWNDYNTHKTSAVLGHPDGSVTTAKVADGAITTIKLADGSVVTSKIVDGSITSVKIANSAVGTIQINDGAITSVKLADGSVTTAKLASQSVTIDKLDPTIQNSTNLEVVNARVGLHQTYNTLEARLNDEIGNLSKRTYVSAIELGADNTGAVDATTVIQNGISNNTVVFVPAGNYRIDGTIVLYDNQELILARGATLWRYSADSTSTEPIVRLGGNFSVLRGDGTIQTQNSSPKGIVRVGSPDSGTTLAAVGWPEIHDVTLWGVAANGNIGLHLVSSQPYSGGSLYNGKFNNIKIRYVGTGVQKEKYANAHTFTGINFYQLTQYAYRDINTIENSHYGGFIHSSPNITVIQQESNCSYNEFYGVHAEPGGSAIYYNIDSTCLNTYIFGNGNCSGVSVNNSTSSVIVGFSTLSVPTILNQGTFNQGLYGMRIKKDNVANAGTAVITINLNANMVTGFARVALGVFYEASSNLQSHYLYDCISGRAGGNVGGATAIQELYNGSSGNFTTATTNFVVSRPSNGVLQITYTNSGVGATGIEVYIEGFGVSSVSIA